MARIWLQPMPSSHLQVQWDTMTVISDTHLTVGRSQQAAPRGGCSTSRRWDVHVVHLGRQVCVCERERDPLGRRGMSVSHINRAVCV